MTHDDLKQRIEASSALRRATEQLHNEVVFRAPAATSIDPLLIVMIISIIVQIIIHCRSSLSPQEIKQEIRDLRVMPFRRVLRLRRRLNSLWREQCPDMPEQKENPVLDAVYELAETADDDAIDELLRIAEESGVV